MRVANYILGPTITDTIFCFQPAPTSFMRSIKSCVWEEVSIFNVPCLSRSLNLQPRAAKKERKKHRTNSSGFTSRAARLALLRFAPTAVFLFRSPLNYVSQRAARPSARAPAALPFLSAVTWGRSVMMQARRALTNDGVLARDRGLRSGNRRNGGGDCGRPGRLRRRRGRRRRRRRGGPCAPTGGGGERRRLRLRQRPAG